MKPYLKIPLRLMWPRSVFRMVSRFGDDALRLLMPSVHVMFVMQIG